MKIAKIREMLGDFVKWNKCCRNFFQHSFSFTFTKQFLSHSVSHLFHSQTLINTGLHLTVKKFIYKIVAKLSYY